MPLGDVRTHLDLTDSVKALEIASNEMLSTTSVNAILAYISFIHKDVGVVKPEYFTVDAPDMRKQVLSSTEAFASTHIRLVSVIKLGALHWQAVYIDLEADECILYDPWSHNREQRVKKLTKAVDELMKTEMVKSVTYRTHTEAFGDLDQDDGTSCGIYCCVFLEYVTNRMQLNEEDVLSSKAYRVRYMMLVASATRKLEDGV